MPLFDPQLLAAGGNNNADWIKLVGVVVVFLFAIIRHLFEASKAASKKKAMQAAPAQPRRPANQPPAPAVAGGQQADPLRSQVEEFLRRAGQRPQGDQSGSQATAQEIELVPVNERQPLSVRTAQEAKRQALPDKPRSQRRTKKRQSVAEHVAEQVAARTESIARHASKLGQRIVNEDREFDDQLKSKFDHTIGRLTDTSTGSEPELKPINDSPAGQIATMLANPDGVRQAVILNEILRRPSDRW